MQASSVQSMPCATEELAKANVSSMLTQIANEKGGVKILNIDIKEAGGMFVAVATYEIVEPELEEKEEGKKGEGDSKNSGKPDAQDDGDDMLLYAAAHHPLGRNLKNGELLPEQQDPANFSAPDPHVPHPDARNDSYNDGTAPLIKEAVVVSPTVPPPHVELADAEVLEEQIKTDFNEPTPGNIPVNVDKLPPNLKPDEISPEPAR